MMLAPEYAQMPDPISRLAFARDEIDRVFGDGYAASHPDVVSAVMLSASMDYMALRISHGLEQIAAALAVETEPEQGQVMSIVRSQLVRP